MIARDVIRNRILIVTTICANFSAIDKIASCKCPRNGIGDIKGHTISRSQIIKSECAVVIIVKVDRVCTIGRKGCIVCGTTCSSVGEFGGGNVRNRECARCECPLIGDSNAEYDIITRCESCRAIADFTQSKIIPFNGDRFGVVVVLIIRINNRIIDFVSIVFTGLISRDVIRDRIYIIATICTNFSTVDKRSACKCPRNSIGDIECHTIATGKIIKSECTVVIIVEVDRICAVGRKGCIVCGTACRGIGEFGGSNVRNREHTRSHRTLISDCDAENDIIAGG